MSTPISFEENPDRIKPPNQYRQRRARKTEKVNRCPNAGYQANQPIIDCGIADYLHRREGSIPCMSHTTRSQI
jgi:hypothetical protein